MKLQIPKIYFSYKTKSGRTKYYKNKSKRRIDNILASNQFLISMLQAKLKVVYGKAKCAQGCVCVFDNEIEGNINDIKWGLKTFLEEDLWIKTQGI